MPQIINSNISALNTQRHLDRSQGSLSTSLQRLSSGLRINSAKDDAAGMAISSRMSAQISGLNVARRNANDGVSLSQTAEGALSTIGENLTRMRDLAVQAANATNSDSDRAALNQEVMQLQAEIQRIGEQTHFNGKKLLDGTFTNQYFQIGANAAEGATVNITDSRASGMGANFMTETINMEVGATGDYRFQINGEEIYANVGATSDLTSLREAINKAYDRTGVKAEFAVSSDGSADKAKLILNGPSFTVSNALALGTDGVYAADTNFTFTGQQTVTDAIKGTDAAVANSIKAQTLTVKGEKGDYLINVEAGDTAKAIADKINAAYDMTGVNATATTTATLTDLGEDGTVTFKLFGKNDELGKTISAEVKKDDLSNLVSAINKENETTGVTAILSDDKRSIRLINEDGYDIKIADWTTTAGTTKTIGFMGATGAAQTIGDGESALAAGKLSFNAENMFSVTSSEAAGAGVVLNTQKSFSAQVSVDDINVKSRSSATQAIIVLDGAINQVNSSRSTLGAVQSRFDAAISNLQATSENLSAARSRIRDTDFAEETSQMAISTILQQSGISILAQANQLPNNVLSLLR